MLNPSLRQALDDALAAANARRQSFATLEHLLLALLDEPDALPVLTACRADVERLRHALTDYVNTQLGEIVTAAAASEAKPTAGFQRVLQRAAIQIQSAGRSELHGGDVLVALFGERESHAVHFMEQQGISRQDVLAARDRLLGER
jgi:ATP-dependent Clp protease ATP-binding subunit ClpA